jgi:hypothetical protein
MGNFLGESSYLHSAVIIPFQLETVIIGEAMTRIRAEALQGRERERERES